MTAFLDSNIVLYALGTEEAKRQKAQALLADNPIISTQVVNECSHVLRRKCRLSPPEVARQLSAIIDVTCLVNVSINDTFYAWQIAERFGFSHFDCLIIASALNAKCSTLYSEDLQNGQQIDNKLTILNPFVMEIGE